ncbi:MAG: hypothetical protein AMJ90_00190 [candidate division Zixibacteria bacterium SM23_73_2]|nr:MAG: hypothetical protein AMJ90_00190 [candidate division Zixibacteria bacterium SM23_73_2]
MCISKIRRRKNSLRLKDFDYTKEGYYFVTINCKRKSKYFETEKAKKIITRQIVDLENRYKFLVDCFAIIPDHIHLIIILNRTKRISLSAIIQYFKSLITKDFRNKLNAPEKFWQRSFYDHVIRNEKDYLEKKRYILNNPFKRELLGRS